MADFLNRLLRASQWGAVLAIGVNCGGESGSDSNATGGTSSGGTSTGGASTGGSSTGGASTGGASTGGSSGTTADASVDSSTLPKVPYPTPAGCAGPNHEGGYWGQCCEKVGCMAATNGACPPADKLSAGSPKGYPTGSGSCSCGSANTGPFAPQDPATEEACCYIFSSIGCDGRPLVVDGKTRLAPLVARMDWARTAPAA